MAPLKSIKTYINKRKKPSSESERALNTLFYRNQRKRWESSIEKSGPSEEKSLETTFDNLRKGELYNDVKFTSFLKNVTVDSEESKYTFNQSTNATTENNYVEVVDKSNENSSGTRLSPMVVLDRIPSLETYVDVDDEHKSQSKSFISSPISNKSMVSERTETEELVENQTNCFISSIESKVNFSNSKQSPWVVLHRIPSTQINVEDEDKPQSRSFISYSIPHISIDKSTSTEKLSENKTDFVPGNEESLSKLEYMGSLNLCTLENSTIYASFKDSVERKSTPYSYHLRKKRKCVPHGPSEPTVNYSIVPSLSVSAMETSDPDETVDSDSSDSDETFDYADLLRPTISSTPNNLKSISNQKQTRTFGKENLLLQPDIELQFEDSSESLLREDHQKKSVSLKQNSKIMGDSKLSKKTYVILEHMPQLEDVVQNVITKSSPINMKFLNVRKNNFVTRRKVAPRNCLLQPASERRNTLLKISKLNRKRSRSLRSNVHKCNLNCEHFQKIPKVVLTRFDVSKTNSTRNSLEKINKSSVDSSVDDFKGFDVSENLMKRSNKEPLSHDRKSKTRQKPINKDDFQGKECFVILERMNIDEVLSNNGKLKNKKCSDCWVILSDSESCSKQSITVESSIFEDKVINFVNMEPGKKFRRSVAILRNKNLLAKLDCLEEKSNELSRLTFHKRNSVKLIPVSPRDSTHTSELHSFAQNNSGYVSILQSAGRSSLEQLENSLPNVEPVNDYLYCHTKNTADQPTARDIVLRRCGQTKPINFSECYPTSALQHCQKLGEGVFGEVFMRRDKNGTTVMKIIPIEGEQIVNLEKQKTFKEIISEIIISLELSNLRTTKRNHTNAFVEVKAIRCVEGCYPERLLELWELYDENKKSENDSPEMFLPDQLYIVLELENVGNDLESYQFNNALQALSVFEQVACALAVAESAMQFEHRDLHWGNVLVKPVDEKSTVFLLDGKEIVVNNRGVKASIIDYTLSRVENEGVIIFNDLSMDQDLFTAKGDYQFDIYRKMQENNGNDWQSFKPYTNILWLHYLLRKAIDGFRYKNIKSKQHSNSLSILKGYEEQILDFNSTSEFVEQKFTQQILIH